MSLLKLAGSGSVVHAASRARALGLWVAALLILAVAPARVDALNFINGYDPGIHNRFESGSFPHGDSGDPPPAVPPVPNANNWAAQYDFSGVGWATNRSFRHVTMITPSHFVNANHAPLTNHKISFLSRTGQVHTFQSGVPTQISGDLSVGTLTTLAGDPVDVTDYDISYYPLYSADHTFYQDQTVIRYGAEGKTQWETDPANPDQGPRISLGKVTWTGPNLTVQGWPVHPADQVHASTPINGDSGSPIFYVHDGALTIAATTYTTGACAFVGADLAALNAHLALEGHSLTVLESSAADGAATIARPSLGEEVVGLVDITGTATDDNFDRYELEYYVGELNWQIITSSTTPVVDGVLYSQFDTALPGDGSATLRLTIYDTSGASRSTLRSFEAGTPPTYDPVENNRFAVGSFAYGGPGDPPPVAAPVANSTAWGAQFDLSGVGWNSQQSHAHVAMVSPSHYVGSFWYPVENTEVNFVNRTGQLHTFLAGPMTQVSGALGVGTLTTLAGDPVDVTTFDIEFYPLYSADGTFFRDRIVLRYGGEGSSAWQNDPSSDIQGPRYTLERVSSANSRRIRRRKDGAGLPPSDQALDSNYQLGDEGSPLFYAHNGDLTIAGIHLNSSVSWYVGDNLAALDTYMATEGYSMTVLEGTPDGTADITHPAANANMEGVTDIIGTATDDDFDHYELQYYSGALNWQTIHSSATPVVDGVLAANFDTELMEAGDAGIRLKVVDTAGQETILNRWFYAGLGPVDQDPTGTGGEVGTGTTGDIDDQDPTGSNTVGTGTGPDIDDRDDAGTGTGVIGTEDDGAYDPTDNGRDSSTPPTTSGGGGSGTTGDPDGRDSSTPPTTSGGGGSGTGDPNGRDTMPLGGEREQEQQTGDGTAAGEDSTAAGDDGQAESGAPVGESSESGASDASTASDGGCRSAGGTGGLPMWLSVSVAGFVLRRRRAA